MNWIPSSCVISAPVCFQDTVVALQALSKYGALTFTKWEKAATVTVKSSESFSKEFQVDETNRLLLQEVTLPEIPGEYSTVVSGSGCVYLQVRLPGFRGWYRWENKFQELDVKRRKERKKERQTDRKKERKKERQKERQTDRHASGPIRSSLKFLFY